MDCTLLHCASGNLSDHTRMSMTAVYHSVDEQAGVEDPMQVLVNGRALYRGNDSDRPVGKEGAL